MKKLLVASLFLLGSVLLLTNHVSADIFDTYGFGTRGSAMGGAMCSIVDGASSVYYNPAGLGKTKGFDLDVGYFRTFPSMDINVDVPESDEDDDETTLFLPSDSDLEFGAFMLGVALNLDALLNLPLSTTFGMGIATMDDMTVAVLEDIEESQYAYLQYGAPLKLITTYFGFGIEAIPDMLYVGVGAHAMVSGSASANLTLETEDMSTTTPTEPASQDVWMEMDMAIEPMFGIACQLTESLGLGFSYKHEIMVDIDKFLAALTLQLGSTGAYVPAQLAIITNYNPTTFQYGISYRLMETLLLSFDIRQEKWSEFTRGPARNLRRTETNEEFELNNVKFDDVTSFHLGVQMNPMENMNLYAGYADIPTPVKSQSGFSNYLGNDRQVLSCGGELCLVDPFNILKFPVWVGGSLQYHILKKSRSTKQDVDTEPDFNYYDFSHKGEVISIMLTARINYDFAK